MAHDLLNAQRSRKLFVHCRLKRMVKKYMIYVVKRQSMLACTRLSRLARKLVAKDKGRRACFNLSRLARKLLQQHEKKRQLRILGRWSKLINGVLGKSGPSEPSKTTVMERWEVLVGGALRQSGLGIGGASYHQLLKEKVLDPRRKK